MNSDTANSVTQRHHLLAILAADVAGYSRLMSLDDKATVAALDVARAVFQLGVNNLAKICQTG